MVTSVWSCLRVGWGGLRHLNVRVEWVMVGWVGWVGAEEVNGTCRLIREWLWWDASAPWRRTRRWTRGSSLMLWKRQRTGVFRTRGLCRPATSAVRGFLYAEAQGDRITWVALPSPSPMAFGVPSLAGCRGPGKRHLATSPQRLASGLIDFKFN